MRIGTFNEYKGYIGSIEFSVEDNRHHGILLNIKDFVNYCADSVEDLYEEFKKAVDDYIEFKREIGEYYV